MKHDRQMRLREVGPLGQARLEAARVELHVPFGEPPTVETWIAKQYLERAGVSLVEETAGPDCVLGSPPRGDGFPHEDAFSCAAAREIAKGSHRALRLVCDLLETSK